MLNLFPIQFLSLLAYAMLRIVIGIVFLVLARKHITEFSTLAPHISWPGIRSGRLVLTLLIISELIIGGLLIVGLYTQLAALMSIALCLKLMTWHHRFPIGSIPTRLSFVLLLAISISLFITGAGFFAFDLPI
jgi:uncharacterized membrane protein YphA (DoxX/SURF4 family)